jgi:hypothetical protein
VDGSSIAGAQWTGYMKKVAEYYDTGGFGSVPASMLYP